MYSGKRKCNTNTHLKNYCEVSLAHIVIVGILDFHDIITSLR